MKSIRETCIDHALLVQRYGGRPDHIAVPWPRIHWLVEHGYMYKKTDGTYEMHDGKSIFTAYEQGCP